MGVRERRAVRRHRVGVKSRQEASGEQNQRQGS